MEQRRKYSRHRLEEKHSDTFHQLNYLAAKYVQSHPTHSLIETSSTSNRNQTHSLMEEVEVEEEGVENMDIQSQV